MMNDNRQTDVSRRATMIFRLAVVIAIISGMSALIHQLVWTRRMVDLLGASHESATRVFGCFFLGLSLGAAIAAQLVPWIKRPWRWLGGAELMVILFSLPAIFLPIWSQPIWPALGTEALLDWRGAAVKWLASVMVVLPPAVFMGMTLPFLGAAVLKGELKLQRQGVWLYAANTVGGLFGLILASLVLLHWVGAAGTLWVAVSFSLLVVASAWMADQWFQQPVGNEFLSCPEYDDRDRQAHGEPPTKILEDKNSWDKVRPLTSSSRSMLVEALAISFFSGFAILAYEVAILQVAMFVAPLSFYAPAAILMVIIGLLALGAAILPWLIQVVGSTERVLGWSFSLTGLITVITPIWFFMVIGVIGSWAAGGSFTGWMLGISCLVLLSLGPAVFFAALVFPSLLAMVGQHSNIADGRLLGWMLAANGLGGVIGAEVCHRLLLPAFGPYLALGAIGILYLVGALVLNSKSSATAGRYRFAVTAMLAGLFLVWNGLPGLPLINPHLGFELLAYRSGPEGTIAVVDQPRPGSQLARALLMNNQYVLGGSGVRWDQERQLHLPLLLHAQPKRVASIGLATGISAAASLQHSNVEKLTAVELSPIVASLSDEYFKEFHGDMFADPRTSVVIEDGRTFIAAASDQFDVIVGDLFLPWGPGEARLFCLEHFQAVHRALADKGVFCQWLPMFQLTPEHFEVIADTFAEAFPEVTLIVNGFDVDRPVLGMVGFKGTSWDWDLIQQRSGEMSQDGILDPLVRHDAGMQMVWLGSYRGRQDREPVWNTLDNLKIELDAGRVRIMNPRGEPYLIGTAWLKWLQMAKADLLESSTNESEHRSRSATVKLPVIDLISIIEWELRLRKSPLAMPPEELREKMVPMREDLHADLQRWCGDRRWLLD